MATKKAEVEAAATVEAVDTHKEAVDRMKELVPYTLFTDGSAKYSEDVKVGYNGKLYIIKRGETVMIPRAVKDILDQSKHQDLSTARMVQDLVDGYKE